jgi:hypothetical protein
MTFRLCHRQFPVRLAFALTINKVQGQSVKHVGIDLREPVFKFSHGQPYVALSRAKFHKNVKILIPPTTIQVESRVSNVVYPEIFSNDRGRHLVNYGVNTVCVSLARTHHDNTLTVNLKELARQLYSASRSDWSLSDFLKVCLPHR